MTIYDKPQFSLEMLFLLVLSYTKEAPYSMKIEFNKFQQKRIIEIISMRSSKLYNDNPEKQKLFRIMKTVELGQKTNAKFYFGKKAYKEVLHDQKKQHVFYDTIIKKVKKNQPLTCKQFQGLCHSIWFEVDKEHPTPNEQGIVHLLAEAGKSLYDLDKLDEKDFRKWVEQRGEVISKQAEKNLQKIRQYAMSHFFAKAPRTPY